MPPPSRDGDGDGDGRKKRGPHPLAGKYVVLAAPVVTHAPHSTEDGPEATDPTPGGFEVIGRPIDADSQSEAKRLAIEDNEKLQQAVVGDGVFLAAVPAASWQPTLVRAVQPPPVIKGL
jgi:hypothetical protein